VTWILAIWLVGTSPPRGLEVTGFASEAECQSVLINYCADLKAFKCACVTVANESQGVQN
jgi:hypothetical protein